MVVEVDDVEVLEDEGDKLLCLIGEQEVWVDKEHISTYSEVQEKGDVGILVLPGWVVDELELLV